MTEPKHMRVVRGDNAVKAYMTKKTFRARAEKWLADNVRFPRPPQANCPRCYGRGYLHRDFATGEVAPCSCIGGKFLRLKHDDSKGEADA